MIETKNISLKNSLSEIEKLNFILIELSGLWKINSEDVFKLNLVLEELFTNIVSYGYEDNLEHTIDMEFSFDRSNLIIKIVDDAKEFNPLLRDDPDIDIPLEDRKIGGLGIFLTKKMMDHVDYSRIDNKNILIISKKI
jgi:serine/threonine-protein kinase RsbW